MAISKLLNVLSLTPEVNPNPEHQKPLTETEIYTYTFNSITYRSEPLDRNTSRVQTEKRKPDARNPKHNLV